MNIPQNQQLFSYNDCHLLGYLPDLVIEGDKVAFFGNWRCENNLEDNKVIFNAFEEWARMFGARKIIGPVNGSTMKNYRLRLDGFDNIAFLGEPQNDFYQPLILQEFGFQIKHKYFSHIQKNVKDLAPWARKELASLDYLKIEYDIRSLTPDVLLENMNEIIELLDLSFKHNFAYLRPDQDVFEDYIHSVAKKMCPHVSLIAREKETSSIVGIFFVYPDYSTLLYERIGLYEKDISYHEHRKLLDFSSMAIAKTTCIHPEHRSRRLFTLLCLKVILSSSEHYDSLCAALMRDDNHSLNFGKIFPEKRTYGLFEKRIPG